MTRRPLPTSGSRRSGDDLLLMPGSFAAADIGRGFNALVSSANVAVTIDVAGNPGGKSTVRISESGAGGFAVLVDGKSGIVGGIGARPVIGWGHA